MGLSPCRCSAWALCHSKESRTNIAVMVNFMWQPDEALGCPDLKLFLDMSVRAFTNKISTAISEPRKAGRPPPGDMRYPIC